jgi:hypothetical protein
LPPFQSGSLRIESMISRRIIQLRADIGVGCDGHRHQRVHEVGILAGPQPGMHAAHRVAHHQPHMLDAQPLGQQAVVRVDHVGVVVLRELAP